MTRDDLRDVLEIERESFLPAMSESLWIQELGSRMSRNLVVIIPAGIVEKVVGYANFWIVAGEVQLNSIAVKPAYRRTGIAAALMVRMMKMAAAVGITSATLEVRSSNVAAIKFYEKSGFVVKGTRKGYFDHPLEDALIMWAAVRTT